MRGHGRDAQAASGCGVVRKELFDLLKGLLDAFEAGVNGKRQTVAMTGLAPLAKVGVAVAHAGHGTEVLRHEGKGGLAIGDGLRKAFGKIVGDAALVIGFREIGVFGKGLAEFLNGAGVIAVMEVRVATLHKCDSPAIGKAEPDGPQGMFSHLNDHGIGVVKRNGERLNGGAVGNVAAGTRVGLSRNHGKCERGNFSHIGGFVLEQGDDLVNAPAALDDTQGFFHRALGEGGLNRGDEFLGAGGRRRGFQKG